MNIYKELIKMIRDEALKINPHLTVDELMKIDLKLGPKPNDVSTNVALILAQAEKQINNGTR